MKKLTALITTGTDRKSYSIYPGRKRTSFAASQNGGKQ